MRIKKGSEVLDMRFKRMIVAGVLMLSLCLGLTSATVAEAASANSSAGKAFAAALKSKKIVYGKNATYSIGDMDGDGVKDLLVVGKTYAKVYAYKSGKVKRILKYTPEYTLGYEAGKKLFWESGEGAGGWHIAHKLKNGALTEVFRYVAELGSDDQVKYYYQKAGGERKEITEDKYSAISERAGSCVKTLSKKKLIKKLKKLS